MAVRAEEMVLRRVKANGSYRPSTGTARSSPGDAEGPRAVFVAAALGGGDADGRREGDGDGDDVGIRPTEGRASDRCDR